jgi:hypothetical protein
MFFFFVKYIKNSVIMLLVSAGAAILSISVFQTLTAAHVLPWSFDQSLYYLFYFALGYVMKTAGLLSKAGKKSPLLILASVIYLYLLVDNTIYTRIFQQISEVPYMPNSAVLFLNNAVWAVLASFFVFYLAQFISFSFVKFLGEKSLIFLALHVSLGFNLANRITTGRLEKWITNPNLLGFAYTIAAIIIVSPAAFIMMKYLPFLIGKGYSDAGNKRSKLKHSVGLPYHFHKPNTKRP